MKIRRPRKRKPSSSTTRRLGRFAAVNMPGIERLEDRLMFDCGGSDIVPPAAGFEDISSPRSTEVATIEIRFSESVSGVDVGDFRLTHDGSNVPLQGIANLHTTNNRTFVLANLADLTSADGDYEIRLVAAGSGIEDANCNALRFDDSETWRKGTSSNGPIIFDVHNVTPDPRDAPVDYVEVHILDDVNLDTFTHEDIRLVRNSSEVILDDSVSVEFRGSNLYRINGLTSFTTPEGLYEITVYGEALQDRDGNLGRESASDSWVNGDIPKGVIRGTLWNDLDGDGLRDGGDVGLPGWTVYIDVNDDRVYDPDSEPAAVTDEQGEYLIGNLDAGTYIVREVIPDGWDQTAPEASGTLYFSESQNHDGLYTLDMASGAATHIGENRVGGGDVGLAQSPVEGMLYGTAPWQLSHFSTDGSGNGESLAQVTSTGLTYDYDNDTLYSISFLNFRTLDRTTGEILEQLPQPPVDGSSLAYADGSVYMLGGFGSWSRYDIQERRWTLVGYTGNFSDNFGLAHDPFTDTFYAVDDDSYLYTVDPDAAELTVVGDTGIQGSGGLAVVGFRPVKHTVTLGTGQSIPDVDFGNHQSLTPAPDSIDLLADSDTGFSPDDDLTSKDNRDSDNVLFLTVEGTLPGALVTLYADGSPIGSTTAQGEATTIATNGTAELADGVRRFTATQMLPGGGESPASAPLDITIDSTLPGEAAVVSITTDSGDPDDGITNDSTLELAGTADAGTLVAVSLAGAGVIGEVEADSAGVWKFDFTDEELAEGTYSFSASSTDAAGNVGQAAPPLVVEIDSTAPAAAVVNSVSTDTGLEGDAVTSDRTLIVSGMAEVGASISLTRVGQGVVGTATADAQGDWSVDLTDTELGEGSHIFVASATDVAGNAGPASDDFKVVIDTTAPPVPVMTGIGDDTGQPGDQVTYDPTLEIYGTAEPNTVVTVTLEGTGEVGAAEVDAEGNWTLDLTNEKLAEGTHRFSAIASDDAANASDASAVLTVIVDTTEPDAPEFTGIDDDLETPGDLTTSDPTLVIHGTAEAMARVTLTRTGVGEIGSTTAASDGSWSFDYTHVSLPVGEHHFTAVAVDAAGNESLTAGTLDVTITNGDSPIIVVGDHTLVANRPNQRVPIYVTNLPDVTGAQFRAQIGDGRGPDLEPVFGGIDYVGTIWEAHPFTRIGGPIDIAPQLLDASIVFDSPGDHVSGDGLIVTLIVDTTGIEEGEFPLLLAGGENPSDTALILQDGVELPIAITNGSITITSSEVVGRHVLYNNSAFDGNESAVNAADEDAVAPDKVPLLAGQKATFANYSTYTRGINALVVDVRGLADPDGLSADDFEFRMGVTNNPATWSDAPAPASIVVRAGQGADGADRVTILWSDHQIEKTWLQIVVKATPQTGLAEADEFFFGNAPGETGNNASNAIVDGADFANVRDNPRNFLNPASLDDPRDFNRNARVDGIDLAIVRDNATSFITALPLLDLTGYSPAGDRASSAFDGPAAAGQFQALEPSTGGNSGLGGTAASPSNGSAESDEPLKLFVMPYCGTNRLNLGSATATWITPDAGSIPTWIANTSAPTPSPYDIRDIVGPLPLEVLNEIYAASRSAPAVDVPLAEGELPGRSGWQLEMTDWMGPLPEDLLSELVDELAPDVARGSAAPG